MTTEITKQPGIPAHEYPKHLDRTLAPVTKPKKWQSLGWTLWLLACAGVGAMFAYYF